MAKKPPRSATPVVFLQHDVLWSPLCLDRQSLAPVTVAHPQPAATVRWASRLQRLRTASASSPLRAARLKVVGPQRRYRFSSQRRGVVVACRDVAVGCAVVASWLELVARTRGSSRRYGTFIGSVGHPVAADNAWLDRRRALGTDTAASDPSARSHQPRGRRSLSGDRRDLCAGTPASAFSQTSVTRQSGAPLAAVFCHALSPA